MLMAYLPAERAIYTADFAIPNPPAAGAAPAPVNPALTTLVQNLERLKIDFAAYVTAHPPNPDRALTRADLMGAVGRSTS